MLHAEYVRSLNCNYERILLDKKPEEKKYQYCILSRGGIKGLLPCGLRYINGMAYLYYDISSKQNVAQIYGNKCITAEWLRDFFWSCRQLYGELERFLLDAGNVIWAPEQIYQDMETKIFYFLYVPYYGENANFKKLMEFLVERIDYSDESLVECVYHMYEQTEQSGDDYWRGKIFEDAARLDALQDAESVKPEIAQESTMVVSEITEADQMPEAEKSEPKKGILSIFESRKNKNKRVNEAYRQDVNRAMSGYAVAEDTLYESEEYGRTVFIEESEQKRETVHRLLAADGKLLLMLDKNNISIGKKREDVELALEDASVSRIHARIVKENGISYLEDLNSTNGTFKNGLRLQPYEKRKLDEGDEIKCGKVILVYR